MKQVVILSGLPGSGKSTYTKKLKNQALSNKQDFVVCSADHFFEDEEGNYNYDPSKIGMAHAACYRKFIEALQTTRTYGALIVVDNTNLSSWEISPYVQGANAYSHEVKIVKVLCDAKVAFERQTHGVPKKTFDHMARNQERMWLPPFWTVEEYQSS